MKKPIVTWHIEKNNQLENIDEKYFAGSFSPSNTEIVLNVQVWNNRWGQETVETIESSRLIICFGSLEDSKLLDLCEVRIDNRSYQPVEVINGKGFVDLSRELSGAANSGTSSAIKNFAKIEVKFNIADVALKNGIKNMFLDLEYLI